jgi:hypothetical protein
MIVWIDLTPRIPTLPFCEELAANASSPKALADDEIKQFKS